MHFMGHRVAEPVVKAYHPAWSDHGTTFFGEKGWISVNRSALYASDKALQKAQIKPDEKHLTAAESQAREFRRLHASREPTISPLESAIRCDTISHLSDICIRPAGRSWDPQKEQIVGDAEAASRLDRPLNRGSWVETALLGQNDLVSKWF